MAKRMTRMQFLKRYAWKFGLSVFILGFCVFAVYQMLGYSASSLLTTPVRRVTDIQILNGNAYLFRSEELLTYSESGIVKDLLPDGTKVSRGSELCKIYRPTDANMDLAAVQARVDALGRVITVLENSLVGAGDSMALADSYKREAEAAVFELRTSIANGNYAGVGALSDEILALFNRYLSLTASAEEVASRLAAAKAEEADLLSGLSQTVSNQTAAGIFYRRPAVDGYESIFDPELLKTADAAALDALFAKPAEAPASPYAGKMVYGYEWWLAVAVKNAGDLTPGTDVTVRFPESDDRELLMQCQNVLTGEEGSYLILKCGETPTDLNYLRVQSVEILLESVSGLYLPESAVYEENGVIGVYVFEASRLHFTPITVLRRGDGYYIAAEGTDEALLLNDIVVTSGKNLYHGKGYR